MRAVFYSVIFLLLISYFLFLMPFPASAYELKSCNQTPDYLGPAFSNLFKDAAKQDADCALWPEGSERWLDELQRATVTGDGKEEVWATIAGNDQSRIIKRGVIESRVTLGDISNVAVNSESLEKNLDQIYRLLPSVEYDKQTDKSYFVSQCFFEDITDRDECAHRYQMTTPSTKNGYQENVLQTTTSYQRTTTLKKQLSDKLEIAKKHLACTSASGAPAGMDCSNYYIAKKTGTDSRTIAKTVVDTLGDSPDPLDTFFKLAQTNPNKQKEIMALEDPKSSRPIYLVLLPGLNPEQLNSGLAGWITGVIAYALERPEPVIIKGVVTGLPQIATAETEKLLRVKPLSRQAAIKDRLNQPEAGVDDLGPGTPNQQILEKAKKHLDQCDNIYLPPTSFLGGVIPSQANAGILNWNFNITGSIEDAQNSPLVLWKACVIQPQELTKLDRATSSDTEAFYRIFRKASTKGFEQDVGMPQPVNSNTSGRTNRPPNITGLAPTCSNQTGTLICQCSQGTYNQETQTCETEEDDHLSYGSSPNKNTAVKGGSKSFIGDLSTKHQLFWPLSSDEHFPVCNFYANVRAKLAHTLPDLDARLGISNPDVVNDICPNPLTWDKDSQDLEMCQIAAKYNVACEYLDAIWVIESARAESCADSNADGPMQLSDGELLGHINQDGLDVCNLQDAWELAARALLYKKYRAYEGTEGLVYTTDRSSRDLQTTAQYNGSNNCEANNATQCRWGTGYSYCDAVVDYISGAGWPLATPEEKAVYCADVTAR